MQVLAMTIRIFGAQNRPSPGDRSVAKKLRENIKEARDYFVKEFPGAHGPPCLSTIEAAFARFHFSQEIYTEIFRNAQSMFVHVGEKAAGDEKLAKFTGNSRDIMAVPSKPDKVGFWNYELCIPLSCGLPTFPP